jgi:hypothetical protein
MLPVSGLSRSSFGATQFSARSRESTAAKLTVTTAEGDKVTLSFKQDTRASFSAGAAYGPNGRAVGVRASSSQKTEVGVKIEGNLSDEELNDIKDLIGQLAQPKEAAAAPPKASSSLDTIQSFEYAYRRRVEVDLRASQYSIDA